MKKDDFNKFLNMNVKLVSDSKYATNIKKTLATNDEINIDDLCFIEPVYYGFDDEFHKGEMIIHKELAEEALEIFRILAIMKFPIERIELIENYASDGLTSMEYNNTMAFCVRNRIADNELSVHGLGMAIDINPKYNPYFDLEKGLLLPATAKVYVNRDLNHSAMVDALAVHIFKHYGWTWGGDNVSTKRYSHFEKIISKKQK